MSPVIANRGKRREGTAPTRGVLFVHACPNYLGQHVEWALSELFGQPVHLQWSPQPALPSSRRGELSFDSDPGIGADITSSLRRFDMSFEVTEDARPGGTGARYMYTPSLGIFRATTSEIGDILISEDRLRYAMEQAASTGIPLQQHLDDLLGASWDAELEPLRYAGDGASVRYLYRVG